MAFNLGAFVGGFSEKLTERIEAEEERVNKRMEEERQLAMRQRAARQAKREKEKAYAEETLGLLSTFGYTEEVAAEILKRGKGVVERAIDVGDRSLVKNMDPNAFWQMSSVSGDLGVDDQKIIDKTLTGEEAVMAQSPLTTGVAAEDQPVTTFGFNRELYSTSFADPPAYENTITTRLAHIAQERVNTSDQNKIDELNRQEDELLKALRKQKEAERENTGSNTPSFNLGTVSSATNAVRKSQLNSVGFKTDLEGNIVGELEGREGAYYAAELATAQALQTTYGGLGDQAMNDNIQTIQSNARRGILAYGKRQQYLDSIGETTSYFKDSVTDVEFSRNVDDGMYSVGDVIVVKETKDSPNGTPIETGRTMVTVYTGVPDASNNNHKFIGG